MQVKKFEAKSMKEALQLVKQELGPEAIILSAKDNKRSFGLAGKGSVEVTAAISERSLQKKTYTENQMPTSAREKFRTQSARRQKELIEETVSKIVERNNERSTASARRAEGRSAGGAVTAALARRRALNDSQMGMGATSGAGLVRRPVPSQR